MDTTGTKTVPPHVAEYVSALSAAIEAARAALLAVPHPIAWSKQLAKVQDAHAGLKDALALADELIRDERA